MPSRLFFRILLSTLFVFTLCFCISTYGQCYNFSNFNIKDGLPQSQVTAIYQAQDRTLWLGTNGGISNFDGKEFISLSKADGLISNSIRCIAQDDEGKILAGTEAGISIIKNGKVIKSIDQCSVSTLKKDKTGVIWGLCSSGLFKLVNEKLIIVDLGTAKITSLSANLSGDLFVVVQGKGIYKLTEKDWEPVIAFTDQLAKNYIFDIVFDKVDHKKLYLISAFDGVFEYNGSAFKSAFNKEGAKYCALIQDHNGNLWVGTQKGAYLIKKDTTIYFNGSNGLADDPIFAIFNDAEHNVWISSSTNGVYKYEGDSFIRFNKFKGKDWAYTVSGINADKDNNLFIGTFTKGLLKYDGTKVETIKNPAFIDRDIYFLYKDKNQNIYFSVQGSGIWKTDGKNFTLAYKVKSYNFNTMLEDQQGGHWVCTPMACSYVHEGKKEEILGFSGYTSSLFEIDKDRVLLGTTTGLFLIKNKKIDTSFEIKELKGACILNMVKQGDHVLIGTLGDGMISYNLRTKAVKKYTISAGLYSNDVYSLAIDENQKLWLGTGRGINKLAFNHAKNRYDVINNNSIIIECNQAAILNYKNSILVGTISGLVQCKTTMAQDVAKRPVIHLNRVNVYHKTDNTKDQSIFITNQEEKRYEFDYDQSHISMNYKGVFLTNPQGVTYRYKLAGLDENYGKVVKTTQVEYSALRPGKYTFYVYAIANGQKSNISKFSFVIVPPFYDTTWFIALSVLVVVFLIWVIFYSFFKSKEHKKQELEQIKRTEQNKIRKQTSEDFHDDIGNKLTRINVLSEILDKKMSKDQVEQKELIRLIKENAGLLYNGTKDILWALNPQSNNLFEILMHIKDFGIDLFQNTGIKFNMDGILLEYQNVQLPMELNRNFTLIFKEILNNVLKHAKAEEVLIMVVQTPQKTIDVFTIDNGVGFDMKMVEKGNGLINIQTRCKRIKADFEINSMIGKGTTSVISTKIVVTNSP